MKRPLFPLAAVVLLSALSGCLAPGDLVGKPSPPFSILTSAGETVNESSFHGRYLIVDLMATWCGPCRLQVEHLKDVQRAYGDRVAILSVGTDRSETPSQLDAWLTGHDAAWPHGLDHDGNVARSLALEILPKIVVLDPAGVVVLEAQGEVLPATFARVIDPAGAPPLETRSPSITFALAVLAAMGGFLAFLNPYRRFHRDSGAAAPMWVALAGLAALSLLAWRFSGLVSPRATYGSLALGALSVGSAVWWLRARSKAAETRAPSAPLEAVDRAYEAAPHFALALVVGLTATDAVGYFAPVGGFLLGAAAAVFARHRLAEDARTRAGLAGLVLVGLGLLAFGARILAAEGGR